MSYMLTEYQPYKIINNRLHPISSRAYDTKEEAIEYAKSRGLLDRQIGIKEIRYMEKWIREFQVVEVHNGEVED